jgi:hypothetical protein
MVMTSETIVMTSARLAAAVTSSDGGFNVGTLLMFVGGAVLLAFFCSIGVIARMRENRLEARRQAVAAPPTTERSPRNEPPTSA